MSALRQMPARVTRCPLRVRLARSITTAIPLSETERLGLAWCVAGGLALLGAGLFFSDQVTVITGAGILTVAALFGLETRTGGRT